MRPFLFVLVLSLALIGVYALMAEGQSYYQPFALSLLGAMVLWLFVKYAKPKGAFFDFIREKQHD